MKIAVVSDIHDNVWNLKAALEKIQDADLLICCGDLCSPFTLGMMGEGFQKPIYVVEGNNDGDWRRIAQVAGKFPHVQLCGELFQGEIGGKKAAINHYPEIALPLAQSGLYDVVFYGHNHRSAVEKHGKTLAINPGTLLGYDPIRKMDVPPTYGLYETETNEAVICEL